MLPNRDSGGKQGRVHRPRSGAGIVDIVAVDSHECSAPFRQQFRGGRGQEWMIVEIAFAAPLAVLAGVDQHRLAGDVE